MVLAAPFMGLIRDILFERFQGAAVRWIGGALLVLAFSAFAFAVVRIRRRRLLRYFGLLVAAVLVALQEQVLGGEFTGTEFAAQVNVAEKIHIVLYGLLGFLLYREYRSSNDGTMIVLPLLWVLPAGVLEEGMQWLVETRLGEIRDVFLNLYGGACGVLFGLSLKPPEAFRWRIDGRWALVCRSLALNSLMLGGFFFLAHLGYEHEDPEIGRFRSWHTLDELHRASIDRAETWRADPPAELSPWHREDYYLTEAGWHTNHRNEREQAGDAYMALQANRILEKYYSPFLDLESFRGGGVRRYSKAQIEALEAATPSYDPKAYLSPVLRHRIYPKPSKPQFLAVWIPLTLGLWFLPEIWRRRRR